MLLQQILSTKNERYFKRACNDWLPLLGCGSSRNVYKLNNNQVLKVAKGELGYLQNTEECNNFDKYKELNLFAEIINRDSNNSWIIQPLAISFKSEDAYLKLILEMISCVENNTDYYSEDIFLNTLYKYLKERSYTFLQDFKKYDSYGRIDNKVYIIDYGMNDNIFNTYFNK